MTEKLNWKPGDTCVMVTNKAKRYTSEFTVVGFDGKYYGIRRGSYFHRVSPNRIFPSREAALASLDPQAQTIEQRLQKLPELCFSTLASTGELICIKRGESGYYPSDWSTDDPAQNKELAAFNNRKLGVTDAQRQAMECGSMAGWDAPGADPTFYDFADQGTVSMTMGGL